MDQQGRPTWHPVLRTFRCSPHHLAAVVVGRDEERRLGSRYTVSCRLPLNLAFVTTSYGARRRSDHRAIGTAFCFPITRSPDLQIARAPVYSSYPVRFVTESSWTL